MDSRFTLKTIKPIIIGIIFFVALLGVQIWYVSFITRTFDHGERVVGKSITLGLAEEFGIDISKLRTASYYHQDGSETKWVSVQMTNLVFDKVKMSANDPELIAIDPMDDKKGLFVGDGVQKSDYQPWFNTNMLGLLIVGLALIWSITRLVRTKPPSKKGRVEQKIAT